MASPMGGAAGAPLIEPRIKAAEDFTNTNGVSLTTHDPRWIKHPASTNTASPVIDFNRVHNEGANTTSVYYRDNWVPGSANYSVRAAIVKRSATAGISSGVIGRVDSAAANYYMFRYQTTSNGWELYRITPGSSVLIGSFAQALTIDQDYIAELDMRGAQITGRVDGVTVITVTDTTFTAPGFAGLRLQNAMADINGIHIDTWRVVQ